MTTVLSKLIFNNEYVVILNKDNEAIGLDKVTGIVGRVILLKNGNKYGIVLSSTFFINGL